MKHLYEILILLAGAMVIVTGYKVLVRNRLKNLSVKLANDCKQASEALDRAAGARALLALPEFTAQSPRVAGEQIRNLTVLQGAARRTARACRASAKLLTRYGSRFAVQGRSQLRLALAAEAECLQAELLYAGLIHNIAGMQKK